MSSSSTVNCLLFRFTPCCGGHPAYFARVDTAGQAFGLPNPPGIPYVWRYDGPVPYTDHLGYSLIPGQCYYIDTETVTVNGDGCGEPWVVPSPTPDNFSETNHENCTTAVNDPKCDCPKTYEFVSCCTGESLIYNVTGLKGGELEDGSTYSVVLDLSDFNTLGCYTINQITVPNPELAPTIDIENIGTTPVEDACNSFFCFVLCQECRCQEFSGTSGTYIALTCDLRQVIIAGTVDGLQISYDGINFELLTEPICLRWWQEQSFGLTRVDSGICESVYWNETGSQFTCPTYYKIVNCLDPGEEYCVSNDLSVEFSTNLVLTVEGETFANKCWRIEETPPCPQTVTISYTITDISCEACLEKIALYFQLTNCNDGNVIIYTSTNLQPYVGSYITLDEYPEDCWFVEVLSTPIPSDIPVNVNQPFISCELCSGPQYLLEDCDIDNPDPNIITNVDLSPYVNPPGQVVTLLNCPDKCWIVSETDPIPTPQYVHVTDSYQNCELCIQPAPVPEPPVYTYKSITPGYNTPGCEPDKFERIVCNFSEAMYRQIMVDAYGITPCCCEDDIKYEIKYELIKLKAIQDPDFNCKLTSSCECTTSTSGLTPCEPQQPSFVCHNYIITALSFEGTSLTLIGCDGTEKILLIESGKSPLQYNVCGRAGQTFVAPPGAVEFSYVETTTICIE